jgi:hypothetical protein
MQNVRKFHEGHSTVGEWQGRGRVAAKEQHGNGLKATQTRPEYNTMDHQYIAFPL